MRYRYVILIAAVLALAAVAVMAVTGAGEKTAGPATSGGMGQGLGAPTAKQGPPAASAMPMATSPVTATTGSAPTGKATMPAGKATMMPSAMATAKPTPGTMATATAKPTGKATAAPTGMATGGKAGERGVSDRGGERFGEGARVGGGASGAYFARVVNYGFVTETINPGGVLTGYVVIQNNGNDAINDALISIIVAQQGVAGTTITSRDQTLSNLNIMPGDQKRVEFSVDVPQSVAPGSYDVRATVQANGQQIDTFTKTVTVS